MSFELAVRLSEIALGFLFLLQMGEHLRSASYERFLFIWRGVMAVFLATGFMPSFVYVSLIMNALFILYRFQGPYNGGSDRMSLLLLCCLAFAHFLPEQYMKEMALGYLALQLILSYFIAGYVKVVNSEWRRGRALQDVFLFSAYPVSETTRRWADKPYLLLAMSWSVMLLELLFPIFVFNAYMLYAALFLTGLFHIANACLFGLNRFFWAWIAVYPILIWFSSQFLGT